MKLLSFAKNCGAHTFNSLFPTDIENKSLVYFSGIASGPVSGALPPVLHLALFPALI